MRKLKKAFSLALALAMCLGLMAVPTAALNPGEEWVGDFVVNGDTLVKYYGDGGAVTIPDGITTIGLNAFRDCVGLTSVTIPNSVTTIGIYAFYGCAGLTSITIPNSVTTIRNYAFGACTGLTSVTIPSSVTFLEFAVFNGCTGLTSVTIPNSVTDIDNALFQDCTSLTSVTIPNSVTRIGGAAFRRCKSLTSITIPSGVTVIENGAFEDCTGLTSVTIPNSVIRIWEEVFRGCTSLTSVTIPSSVTNIGENMFDGCTRLTSVTVLSDKAYLGEYFCFYNCPSLTDIYYSGSKAQWKERGGNVTESRWASYGFNPTVHYNSTGPSSQPTTPTKPDKPAGEVAYASTQTVTVDGKAVEFQMYALKDASGNGTNYIKLRDMAYVLNGTKAQFAVGYDNATKSISVTSGQPYQAGGTEMTTPYSGDRTYSGGEQTIQVNGRAVKLEAVTLTDDNGGGYNYFKLRDLGKALGFNVGWSKEAGVFIESDKPYSE